MSAHRKTVRFILSSFLLLWAASPLFAAETAPALTTQKEKESYSIGYQVGIGMKADGVDVDFEKLVQGLQDAVNGKQPLLGTEDMKKLIVELKKRTQAEQSKKIQAQIVANAKESATFLAENKKKEGVKTTQSGLQYRVLREGDGMSPALEDFVKVNYRGRLIDGKEFDSSYAKGEPARVQVNRVIKGWTEALTMMKTGSKWELYVPPDLAYGRRGHSQEIPPNKVLLFEMELLSVEKGEKAGPQTAAQAGQAPTVRTMNLTGEIAKVRHAYVVRSKRDNAPAAIYTILNGDPKILDEFVKSGRTVPVEVQIVSGDNVKIEKLDGKKYP